MRIRAIYTYKTGAMTNRWYMEVTTLDSGNGADIEINQQTAKELIKEFGLEKEETDKSITYSENS